MAKKVGVLLGGDPGDIKRGNAAMRPTTKKAAVATSKVAKAKARAKDAGVDTSQFEADAAVVREPTQKDLENVGVKAKELKALYIRQAKGQVVMDQIAKDIAKIEVDELPALLDAAGLKTITLKDGSVVIVKKEYYPGINKENEQAAFSWLREHNFAELIKTQVHSVFGKGEDAKALAFMKLLQTKKIAFTAKEGIHAATLKAWVKEQMEKGATLPPSIGVHTVSRAQLKAPQ